MKNCRNATNSSASSSIIFVDLVSRSRGMTPGQGHPSTLPARFSPARKAAEYGLIDEVGDMDLAIALGLRTR